MEKKTNMTNNLQVLWVKGPFSMQYVSMDRKILLLDYNASDKNCNFQVKIAEPEEFSLIGISNSSRSC